MDEDDNDHNKTFIDVPSESDMYNFSPNLDMERPSEIRGASETSIMDSSTSSEDTDEFKACMEIPSEMGNVSETFSIDSTDSDYNKAFIDVPSESDMYNFF